MNVQICIAALLLAKSRFQSTIWVVFETAQPKISDHRNAKTAKHIATAKRSCSSSNFGFFWLYDSKIFFFK